jgi:hypothetical protein
MAVGVEDKVRCAQDKQRRRKKKSLAIFVHSVFVCGEI